MLTFDIDLGDAKYPVFISADIFDYLEERINTIYPIGNIVIIIDENVARLKNDIIKKLEKNSRYYIYIVNGGKNNKSLYSAMKVFEFLDVNNISRDSLIVGIGGGVIGDMAGFVASCWYRGTSLIHIPTTLLSAVDSCVGGKTAINFRSTVNAVGTYHHPIAILIDTKILETLPEREIASGFGEIIKYSCIGSSEISDILNEGNILAVHNIGKLVMLSLKEKEKFVSNDVGEKSKRLFLNFGHTLGHAIEFSTVYNGEETLRHGEGVALGMLAIYRICANLGYVSEKDLDDLKAILLKYKLPIAVNSKDLGISRKALINRVLELCFKDKKRTTDQLRLILVTSDSIPFIYKTDSVDLIVSGIEEVVK